MKERVLKKWYVLYTKPRHELKVLQALVKIGLEAYTPTKVETRQWSDRKKKIEVPLLPSMVLVSIEEKKLNIVFNINGVVRYLFQNGKRAVVLEEEVVAMQNYLNQKYAIPPEQQLKVGSTVTVPFLNEEATLIAIKGKNCLAQLKKLGHRVSFQLS
jgi:transcription antitermination factor NusG